MFVLCQKLEHMTDKIVPVTAPPLSETSVPLVLKVKVLERPLGDTRGQWMGQEPCGARDAWTVPASVSTSGSPDHLYVASRMTGPRRGAARRGAAPDCQHSTTCDVPCRAVPCRAVRALACCRRENLNKRTCRSLTASRPLNDHLQQLDPAAAANGTWRNSRSDLLPLEWVQVPC